MTNYQDDYLPDYLLGVLFLTGMAVSIFAPAVWFVATGHWLAFFLTIFFGKFAGWLLCAPLADDEDE